jgi:hypothetical protein
MMSLKDAKPENSARIRLFTPCKARRLVRLCMERAKHDAKGNGHMNTSVPVCISLIRRSKNGRGTSRIVSTYIKREYHETLASSIIVQNRSISVG